MDIPTGWNKMQIDFSRTRLLFKGLRRKLLSHWNCESRSPTLVNRRREIMVVNSWGDRSRWSTYTIFRMVRSTGPVEISSHGTFASSFPRRRLKKDTQGYEQKRHTISTRKRLYWTLRRRLSLIDLISIPIHWGKMLRMLSFNMSHEIVSQFCDMGTEWTYLLRPFAAFVHNVLTQWSVMTVWLVACKAREESLGTWRVHLGCSRLFSAPWLVQSYSCATFSWALPLVWVMEFQIYRALVFDTPIHRIAVGS